MLLYSRRRWTHNCTFICTSMPEIERMLSIQTLNMEFSWIGLFLFFFRMGGRVPRGPSSQCLLLCFEVWLFNVLSSKIELIATFRAHVQQPIIRGAELFGQNNGRIIVCSLSPSCTWPVVLSWWGTGVTTGPVFEHFVLFVRRFLQIFILALKLSIAHHLSLATLENCHHCQSPNWIILKWHAEPRI